MVQQTQRQLPSPIITVDESRQLQEKQKWSLRVITVSVVLMSLGLGLAISPWLWAVGLCAFLIPTLGNVPVGLKALPPEEQHKALDQESARLDAEIQAKEGGEDLLARFAVLEAQESARAQKELEEKQQAALPPSQGASIVRERPLREKIKSIHLRGGGMKVTVTCWKGLEPKFFIGAKEVYQGAVSVDIVDGVLHISCSLPEDSRRVWAGGEKPVHVTLCLDTLHRATVSGSVVAHIHREKMSDFALSTHDSGSVKLIGEGRRLFLVHKGREIDVSHYARTDLVATGSTVGLTT